MMRIFVIAMLLYVCLVMAGCATTANYEKILQSWIGADADHLVSTFGAPDKTSTLSDGGRVIEYVSRGNVLLGGFTYTIPQTTYHYGSLSAYGRYGGSAYGSYSGTSTTYIQQQTPMYNIPLVCITRFRISPANKVIDWQWQGNNCKALPPEQKLKVGSSLQQKYVDIDRVVRESQYGKKAEELLSAFEKEHENIEKEKANIQLNIKKTGEDKELVDNANNQLMGQVIDSQAHVRSVRKFLTEFVYRQAISSAREVANRNNYEIIYDKNKNFDDISDEVIREINNNPAEKVEIYFQNIK